MRYHINNKDEVGLCKAQEGKCPFKDKDGNEKTHYTTRTEANYVLSEKLNKKYSPLSSTKKRTLPKKFIESRENIKKLLIDLNIKEEKDLKNVNTVQEMVNKWFDGDRSKYNIFRDMSTSEINNQTKNSIYEMIQNNISVNIAKENNIDTKPNTTFSNIDILDDDFDNITLEKIRENKLEPINFNK